MREKFKREIQPWVKSDWRVNDVIRLGQCSVWSIRGEGLVLDAHEMHWRRVEGGTRHSSNRWGLMESSGCKLSVGNICLFVHLLHSLFSLAETH